MSEHLERELAGHVLNTEAELESIRRQLSVLGETIGRTSRAPQPAATVLDVTARQNAQRITELEAQVRKLAALVNQLAVCLDGLVHDGVA